MTSNLDNIYATPSSELADFIFDQKVAGVFGDMIRRSVPGYGQIINTIGELSKKYVQPNSNIYDLGCSLGSATLSIRRNILHSNCKIFAIDNSESMLSRCRENITAYVSNTPVELLCEDIRNIEIQNASFVVLNFTLQFVPKADRYSLLQKIYNGMNKGGMLIISEKIFFEDDIIQNLLDESHLDFKRANGYSELEISQKRSALENVMHPESLNQHIERIEKCGFKHNNVWFQCFNFTSMVAIK